MTGTNGEGLKEILESINKGETQLPDFQRGWVWDDNRIRALVASITNGYPVGAAMFLDSTGNNLHFKHRVVEGVRKELEVQSPRYLILDGQQRFTSLYRSIFSKQPVETKDGKGKKINRYYYLYIPNCLSTSIDREEGIISVPETRIVMENIGRDVKIDLSSREKEFEMHYFPLNIVFDPSEIMQWQMGYCQYHKFTADIITQWTSFYKTIIDKILSYRIPLIILPNNIEKEAVCKVFENVNTGGVTLTVFELVTASFAAENFELRKDWDEIWETLRQNNIIKFKNNQASFWNTDFLTAITLLVNYQKYMQGERNSVSCKKRDVLDLKLEDYKQYRVKVISGVLNATKFLMEQKIFTSTNLPYTSQLIPLSVLFAIDKDLWYCNTNKKKLEQWYWCGVFGELYGGANETRYVSDIVGMMKWGKGSEELPETIVRANFNYSRLQSLYTRNSAAYKGVMALILKNGAVDFISGSKMDFATYIDEATDIHHIFPANWCTKKENNIPQELWNSVINKTPIFAKTNRSIGGRAPSEYIQTIENKQPTNTDNVNLFISSHAINVNCLRNDDFYTFYEKRASDLCDLIEEVMGKSVDGRPTTE